MSLYVVKLTDTDVAEDALSRIRLSTDESTSDDFGNLAIKVQIEDEEGNLHPLIVEAPWMKAQFGVSSFEVSGKNGNSYFKHKLPVIFHEYDSDKKQKAYITFCEGFDKMIVDAGCEHSGEWLQMDDASKEVVTAFYNPHMTYSKDPKTGKRSTKYPQPKLQYKLPSFKNDEEGAPDNFSTRAFNEKSEPLKDLTKDISRGAIVKNLVECTGIWVVNKKFGTGWRSLQMKVKNPALRNAYMFEEDSDAEDGDAEAKA
tara:strand:- start:10085 stop:10855 length:771 start_codon:yes stop_codon:yes gene_type:complete